MYVRTDTFNDLADEQDETFDLTATLNNGLGGTPSDNGTATILDDDVITFPSGLAYTVAGSKTADGEQLYSVDLETGETIRVGEILVNGAALGPNSTEGMEMNPDDGYLYAVAKKGGDSWLIKINPITAETEVIDQTAKDGNSFAGVTASAFDVDGSYYLAYGNKIYIYDLTANTLELIAQGANNQSASAIAINTDVDAIYIAVGRDFYKAVLDPGGTVESFTYVGVFSDGSTEYTIDGLSVDDNGTIWALDNAGNILEVDPVNGFLRHVTTLAVDEVTGSGAHSLAISNVDPGTYVVLSDAVNPDGTQDLTISDTTYLPDDGTPPVPNPLDPEDDGWTVGLPDPSLVNVEIYNDGAGTTSITQDGTYLLNNVHVQSDNEADITVSDFENVEIQLRGDGASTLTINDALRGCIDTGEGDDTINLNPGAGPVGDKMFFINADGGNDIINLSDDVLNPAAASTDTIAYSARGGEEDDVINNFNPATDVLKFYDVLDGDDAGTTIDIADLTNVEVAVNGVDVELTVNGVDGTTHITLEGINSGGAFTGDTSLGDLVAGGLNVQVTPDTFAH